MASADQENNEIQTRTSSWFKALPEKSWAKVVEISESMKKLGKDDPRRIIHSLKVGLALTLVSLFYYFKPLYDGFGVDAMWAVLTVVVVFEFSVGATLGKGLNRMLATLVGGALGIGAHRLATLSGETGEPILIATFLFIIAAVVTFMRFFPKLKARYDYGLMVFILTFCLISVSGYRDDQVLDMAHMRLSTVIVGSCIAVIVCICICPVWIGEDLHKLVGSNLEKIGTFLEGFGGEYFRESEEEQSNRDKSFLEKYESVLNSKSNEENMANLARWEPCHGRFNWRHPWSQYLKIGTLSRECAYKIESLHSYLNSANQTPMEIRSKIKGQYMKISFESGKALKELATSIKKMKRSKSADAHIAISKAAAESLKLILKTSLSDEANLLEIMPLVAVASLLLEIIECTEKIAAAVYELASLAKFKTMDNRISPEQPNLAQQTVSNIDLQCHVITVGE